MQSYERIRILESTSKVLYKASLAIQSNPGYSFHSVVIFHRHVNASCSDMYMFRFAPTQTTQSSPSSSHNVDSFILYVFLGPLFLDLLLINRSPFYLL
jgi:hypothetical protein